MTMLEAQSAGIPVPVPHYFTQPFWDACATGELTYQRCTSCDNAVFDPSLICRHCGSRDLAWTRSSGSGSVYSWSIVWRPLMPTFTVPYAVAIIDMDDGYQIMSNVIGCDVADVKIGLRVQVEFVDIGDGVRIPNFRPSGGQA